MVIWGTGNICRHLLESNKGIVPVFFIDNDIRKANTYIYEKKVLHPSQIENWEQLYIVIAVDNYIPIKEQLRGKKLEEGKHFIWYRDFLFEETLGELINEAERFVGLVEADASFNSGKNIVFSDFLAFDKGVCDYVNAWKEQGVDAILLSEAYWVGESYAKEKMNIPVYRLPAVLSHNQYLKENEVSINKKYLNYVKRRKYLLEAAQNLRMGFPNMSYEYEYLICYYADIIVKKILEKWMPPKVIVWNSFYAFHTIISSICKRKGKPILYMEFGNIPGTIILEDGGQMGESYPAKHIKEFMQIGITKGAYQEAEDLIDNLRNSGINRNVQPKNDFLKEIKQKMIKGRPIVLYAGQNDNASGMQPYTENTRKNHSPIFKSSDEAAIFLAEICKKNNWNYIYKPHPMMVENCTISERGNDIIVVNNVNVNELIDFSDVVITILSTISYIALIRNKPVLMLGYTQLKGKNCTYEVFDHQSDVESRMIQAIQYGFTKEMKAAFINHIAQIKKFYDEKGLI